MAKGQEIEPTTDTQIVGYDPASFGDATWTTEHVEAGDQVKFDTIGDTLIGVYAGSEVIYPDPEKDPTNYFVQLTWTIPGGSVFTNAGHELEKAFTSKSYNSEGQMFITDKIPVGTITRVVFMKLVDVDQNSEMKSFRVDSLNAGTGNSADNLA